MAWVKVPPEHHPIFRAALPKGATTKNMFGGVAAFVNDNMFGGLFARSIVVRLSPADEQEARALDGATQFDPMGDGRAMSQKILMPESLMDEPAELRAWLRRAYDYVATLPRKPKKAPKKSSAKKSSPKKTTAKKKPAPKKPRRKR